MNGMKSVNEGTGKGRRGGVWMLAVLMLLILSLVQTGAAEGNLLVNGSFEETDDKGLPAGWRSDAYNMDTGYTVFSVSAEEPREGSSCAGIRNIGDNDARFSQQVSVEPESLYRFSGYIRTRDVTEGRGANLSVEGLYTFSESVMDTSDGWQYIEWYGETGEDQTSVTLFARLGGYSGESRGEAWFDDLRLEKVDRIPGDIVADRWYSVASMSYYDESEEPSTAGQSSAAWPRMIMISLTYSLFALWLVQWIRRKDAEEDRKPAKRRRGDSVCWFCGLGCALILRMILSYFITGYMVDVNCFTSWGATMADHGPVGFYPETSFCDYPPAYTYILGLSSLLCRWIPGLSAGGQRVIFRLFPALCDLAACLVLDWWLGKRESSLSRRSRRAALLLLAFLPVSILNSACWGQMDSVLSLCLLLVAVFAVEGKWQFSLPCYMLAVLIKPQALMLGFLGLAAFVPAWIQQKESRKKMLLGLAGAAAVLLAIVVPFGLRQEPGWLINLYAGTLSSYPYATVNTANFYYLLGANWDAIANPASPWAGAVFAALCLGFAAASARRGKRRAMAEIVVSCVFAVWNVVCAVLGLSWGTVGTGAMAFLMLLVLCLFLRKKDISFLPFMGGALFLLLYVFGVKMHERYILPAFVLFAAAWGLHRDRRILYILLASGAAVFINESIVLDNSIRLGSSMGHLNQDTAVLARLLSLVQCCTAVYTVHTALDLAWGISPRPVKARTVSAPVQGRRLGWKKRDGILLSCILIVYSAVSFATLGSTKAPQTAWTSTDYTENVVFDLGESRENFTMLYFARVSRYDFSVSASEDGLTWPEETWAQMDQGQCWKWKYVTDSSPQEDGTRSYGSSRHWFSGRYVRLTAHQINLALCEVIFRDPEGRQLPVRSVVRQGGDAASPLYSSPDALVDEQDSMEALPLWFAPGADRGEGEDNLAVAQPGWWNSTYFDEIYHARTAWEFLTGAAPYETSHPPLGKVLMSWGVALFGMTPFGWRFAGALAGVAMLAVLYLVVLQITRKTSLAAFGCGLFALDCMHMTQTQIATIDSFPVLFILLAFFFMLRFLQTDWRTEKRSRVLLDLGLCGLNMGLAISSKWIGIYAGAGLAVLFFWHCFRVLRRDRKERGEGREESAYGASARSVFLTLCAWCVLFFVLVPVCIYAVSYLPYFSYRHFTSLTDFLNALMQSQTGMFNYHSTPGLGMDHPFYSPWYEWPVIGKPMFYATKQYLFLDEFSYSIFCFGNPVIWWAGIPAMLLCAWALIHERERRSLLGAGEQGAFASWDTALIFLLVGFLAQYLPWTLVPRGTYIYHYFASVPFLIIAITLCFAQLRAVFPRAGKIGTAGFLLLSLGAFLLFFPYVTGILAPVSWLDLGRQFLKIWY